MSRNPSAVRNAGGVEFAGRHQNLLFATVNFVTINVQISMFIWLVVAAVLYALEAGGPRLFDVPAAAWIAGIGGLWALLAAWPRR
mgnify:CR=1 FL=1